MGTRRSPSRSARSFGSDVLVADAELDIEGKFNASVDVSLDGETHVNRPLVSRRPTTGRIPVSATTTA